MAFVDQLDVASTPSFQNRVQQAILAVAVNVQGEATSTGNHTNRANFAQKVLANSDGYVRVFALAAASDGTTVLTTSDANLQTRISNIWNAMAGTL